MTLSRSASCFAEILSDLVELTDNEIQALKQLEARERNLRRGAVLQRENEPDHELYILRRGMMMSYVLLEDGSRQILRFLFPGDMIGLPGILYRGSPEALCALSDCVVCPFDRSALSNLIVQHPRLAALILVVNQIERVSLTDRLAMLGRTTAKARVGALLLELRDRLRATDKSIDNSFTLGLTQEEIGDATGLTSVHVNRMLRQLEQEGSIARVNGHVTLLDESVLARSANYVNRFEGIEIDWLPVPR
ncbi:Crp/Fnr family transcriptional regulator [Stakelama saccharophila]|uniref:Crp/Fnr family transcriptional regulator n=1 Tax=Stakelama saccharophila TaxID=3075605 RepID=A0ABZ0BAG5_9SPHN|nr:Crp/Fnr family transcriptional regulator [Stakelama sp. W311]WNO54374.1 Crp/Fnr family transcriptional regulator [Stakelama sp. W311]